MGLKAELKRQEKADKLEEKSIDIIQFEEEGEKEGKKHRFFQSALGTYGIM